MADFITHACHYTGDTGHTRQASEFTIGINCIGCSNHLLGRLRHRVRRNNRQTGLGQNFLAQLFIRAFHAHDQRHFQMHLLGRRNHTLGDHVAFHDAAENIDQNRFEVRIFEHDFEGFGDFFRTRATAHIEEVRWFATVQLDGIHRGHCQTRAINQTADIAIERNVGQAVFGGFDFRRVFFVQIAHFGDFRVTEQGV